MFQSVRSTISAIALVALIFVSSAVVILAVIIYEDLYTESASKHLNGLSENLASDLIPYLASSRDSFAINNLLLRLDQHDNVRLAAILDLDKQVSEIYIGTAIQPLEQQLQRQALQQALDTLDTLSVGTPAVTPEGNVIVLKMIGEPSYPLGYLLMVNDLSGPLNSTKWRFVRSVLPFVLILVVLTTLLLLYMQGLVLKPLFDLGRLTHRIRKTKNYTLTAELRGKKEIRELTKDINSLLRDINEEMQLNKEQNSQLLEQQSLMERLANFDSLTALPNRQFILDKLALDLRLDAVRHVDIALLFCDLDGFKAINDAYGHRVGDQLLQECASMLVDIIHETNAVARLGGDEFLITVDNFENDEQLKNIAALVIKQLSKPITIEDWTVQIGVSIGIAKASDANYDATTLISNADMAMYASKLNGKGTTTLFTTQLVEDHKRKLLIAQAIDDAVTNNEFTLFYQPKMNSCLEVAGYEALIRWHSPTFGFIPPDEFISIAEHARKITTITHWVLEQACKDISALSAHHTTDISVAINLSVHDLRDDTLLSDIKRLFSLYEVKAEQFEFEITESTYLENLASANVFIDAIHAMGSTVALDDFGTGYSSLGYLTQISIDTLKIDKQFIDSVHTSKRNRLITNTIIEMAKQLKLSICAEGVENKEQLHFLLQSGCHLLQGFYFSSPQPLDVILKTDLNTHSLNSK